MHKSATTTSKLKKKESVQYIKTTVHIVYAYVCLTHTVYAGKASLTHTAPFS